LLVSNILTGWLFAGFTMEDTLLLSLSLVNRMGFICLALRLLTPLCPIFAPLSNSVFPYVYV